MFVVCYVGSGFCCGLIPRLEDFSPSFVCVCVCGGLGQIWAVVPQEKADYLSLNSCFFPQFLVSP